MARFLSVKNLERYQHYKKRSPPWVKIHREILTDYELISLPVHLRFAHVGLIILASETENMIPFDVSYISLRLGVKLNEEDLTSLIQRKFLLASCKRSAIKSASNLSLSDRGETETETEERRVSPAHPPVEMLKKPKRVPKAGTPWPEGFTFTDKHRAIAEGLSLNVSAEFVKFKDKALSKGWHYVDWEAGFRTWLNNAAEYKAERMAR